jgi:brefeldin A-resistance guanine nucleotide exchange factor 1
MPRNRVDEGEFVADTAQEEAVRENLKNVLLFMASSGYLVPPKQDASKEELWTETWKRIDRFLPDLRSELGLEDLGAEPPTEEKAGNDSESEINKAA